MAPPSLLRTCSAFSLKVCKKQELDLGIKSILHVFSRASLFGWLDWSCLSTPGTRKMLACDAKGQQGSVERMLDISDLTPIYMRMMYIILSYFFRGLAIS